MQTLQPLGGAEGSKCWYIGVAIGGIGSASAAAPRGAEGRKMASSEGSDKGNLPYRVTGAFTRTTTPVHPVACTATVGREV